MSEKGTLCHAMTRWDRCEGISCLHGLVWVGGGGGEMRGLEGKEKAFGVFLRENI